MSNRWRNGWSDEVGGVTLALALGACGIDDRVVSVESVESGALSPGAVCSAELQVPDCFGGQVRSCNAAGEFLLSPCPTDQFCERGTCVRSCQDGDVQCDGDSATMRCAGGAYVPGDACPGNAPACLNGRCVACSAGAVQCAGATPQRCADGQWQSEVACTMSTPVCSALTGQCVACTAGTARCSADGLREVCDGSGSWAAGTSCGEGSHCILTSGQCSSLPRECTLAQTFDAICTCLVGDRRACGSRDCPSVETCTLSADRTTSKYGPCTPLTLDIPDRGLAEAVRAQLGIASGDLIRRERASEVVIVNGSNAGITSLEGIACLPNLGSLSVPNNQITDLTPVRFLPKLDHLNVRFNQIQQVSPLANLLTLESLIAADNPLSDAEALATLPALNTLDLVGTGITDIAWVTGLADTLTTLEIGQSVSTATGADPNIDIAPIANLLALTKFSLVNTGAVDFTPLSRLPPLDKLQLRSVGLDSLSLIQNQTSLTRLDISSNQVSDISLLASFTRLSALDLSFNPIADLGQLAALPPLEELHVDGIGLTSLTPIQNQTSLTTLTISNNAITDLTPLTLFTALELLDVFNLGIELDCGQPPLSTLTARGATVVGCP